MIALFCLCVALFVSPLKSKSRLEAENAALRHQLVILRRKVRGGVRLTDGDRLFIQLYRWFPTILKATTIVRPETLMRCLSFPKIVSARNDDVIRTGMATTVPDRSTARPSGASLPNPRCVRVSL